MFTAGVAERLEELLKPHLANSGFELVAVEYRRENTGWIVRLSIDKENGVTLEDCAQASRKLMPLIDMAGLIPHAYNLEVSSPGIRRPLKREADFKRFSGQKALIRLYNPIDNRRNFLGYIVSAADDKVTFKTADTGQTFTFSMAEIAKANLDPEIKI